MTPRRSKKTTDSPPAPETKFEKLEQWNGLTPGDAVKIAGIKGRHWRFRCHVTNLRTGATWVDVAELDVPRRASGAVPLPAADEATRQPAVRRVRSFDEERIVPLRKRTRRQRAALSPYEQGSFSFVDGSVTEVR